VRDEVRHDRAGTRRVAVALGHEVAFDRRLVVRGHVQVCHVGDVVDGSVGTVAGVGALVAYFAM
jgi:hypothetical protein